MGDCWQLYCPKVLCSILPPGRGIQRFWCIRLLFRSFYPESHQIPLEDPDLRSCANCCFQVYVHFYGKGFLAFFHHIFKEVYDPRHIPRPDAACPLTKHLFPFHICPSGQGQHSQKSTIQIGQTPAKASSFSGFIFSVFTVDKSCVICLMKHREI